MMHTLQLEIPEEVYNPLMKSAALVKQTPEELAIRWLQIAVRQFSEDPLEKFIGAFQSDISDWADQHDQHIGQNLTETK